MTAVQALVLAISVGACAVVAVLRREVVPFVIAAVLVGVLALGLHVVGWPSWIPHG